MCIYVNDDVEIIWKHKSLHRGGDLKEMYAMTLHVDV